MSSNPVQEYGAALSIVARAEGLPPDAIAMPRGWPARRARHLAFYLAHMVGGGTINGLARSAGVGVMTVHAAVVGIEEARDNRDVDARISALEEAYHDAVAA